MIQQRLRTADTSGSGTRKEVEAAKVTVESKQVREAEREDGEPRRGDDTLAPNDAVLEDAKLEKRVK